MRVLSSEITKKENKEVELKGWVAGRRDHGKIIFIDLRDVKGITQIVFTPQDKKLYQAADKLRPEWVIAVSGLVKRRPKGMENPDLESGQFEIQANSLKVLSQAETPPFPLETDGYEINEDIRMKYRYLDLRRPRLQKNIKLRSQFFQFIRSYLIDKGFTEIETPIIGKSTPEGARDYLVPSRLQPGKFYALPQSPQQYKQLLMVSGFEKYFQIARCFRDEDTRGDRQPEFTQLDIEMSFIETEDILSLVEEFCMAAVKKIFPEKKITKTPFLRLNYQEVIKKYQSDKPDLRENKKNQNELAFGFIVNFPMFEWRKEKRPAFAKASAGKWDAVHHPFTRPQTENIKEIKNNPDKILAFQYDLVCNGLEIGGGSLRSYKPEILEAVFEVMGHSREEIKKQFGHLLEAFQYGVPPHGGIALGLDRLLTILLNEPNIREVIAFPKTGDGRDLMMDAPTEIKPEQLKELKLKIDKK